MELCLALMKLSTKLLLLPAFLEARDFGFWGFGIRISGWGFLRVGSCLEFPRLSSLNPESPKIFDFEIGLKLLY